MTEKRRTRVAADVVALSALLRVLRSIRSVRVEAELQSGCGAVHVPGAEGHVHEQLHQPGHVCGVHEEVPQRRQVQKPENRKERIRKDGGRAGQHPHDTHAHEAALTTPLGGSPSSSSSSFLFALRCSVCEPFADRKSRLGLDREGGHLRRFAHHRILVSRQTKLERDKERRKREAEAHESASTAVRCLSAGMFSGEMIDDDECTRRLNETEVTGKKDYYFFKLGDDLVIDAGPIGNNARFLNHSCSPNCKTEMWQIGCQQRVGIFTIKDVKKGEELTYDYNFEGFWQPGAALVSNTQQRPTESAGLIPALSCLRAILSFSLAPLLRFSCCAVSFAEMSMWQRQLRRHIGRQKEEQG